MPYPFQIIQGTNKIMMVYGFASANRTIHMDKDKPEPAPLDSWMGRSHGRWDGDTLVVDAAGFNGQAWFDRSGKAARVNLALGKSAQQSSTYEDSYGVFGAQYGNDDNTAGFYPTI